MTQSNSAVMEMCRQYLKNAPKNAPAITIPKKKEVTADEPKAKPTQAPTSTDTQSKSAAPISSTSVPPNPDALSKGITLTQDDVDDIDSELAKDTYKLRTDILRDLLIGKRNGLGLPRLLKDEEEKAIEDFEAQYRKKNLENNQDILPEIEDITEFLSKPMEKPKILIEGVLEKGSKMSLAGCSKGYKTWLMLDLALSLACGQPWLALKTTESKVLYLNLEMKETTVKHRIESIVRVTNLQLKEGSLYIWNLRGRAASFDKIIPRIIQKLKDTKYDAILLDPGTKSMVR